MNQTPVNCSEIELNEYNLTTINTTLDLIKNLTVFNLVNGIIFIDSAFEFDSQRNQRSIALSKTFNSLGYFVFFIRYQWHEDDISDADYQIFEHGIMQIPRLKLTHLLQSEKLAEINLPRYFIITIPDKIMLKNYFNMRTAEISICYDIIDNWQAFNKVGRANWYCDHIEQFFINNADVVSAISKKLVQKFKDFRQIKLISNGLLGGSKFLSEITFKDKYHVGYIGHLTPTWFNWDYIFNLADDDLFVIHIIGEGVTPEILKIIQGYPNIILYGYIPQPDLKQYVMKFNIGLIPFIKGPLSESIDPLKVYEYLQFGRPVVSTGIPHLSDYPYCTNTDTFDEFKNAIINYHHITPIDEPTVAAFLSQNTWQIKCANFLKYLAEEHITGGEKNA